MTTRGMWVWKSEWANQAAELAAFCGRHGVTDLYLSATEAMGAKLAPLAIEALRVLRVANVLTHALGGKADWYKASMRKELTAFVDRVAAFNAKSVSGKFDGVSLDVEPWQLAQNKGATNLKFMSGLVTATVAGRKRADAAGLLYSTAIAKKMFKSTSKQGKALAQAAQLIFMAYEFRPLGDLESYVSKVRAYLDTAEKWGAKVVVAIRVEDWEGQNLDDVLNDVLNGIESSLGSHPAFTGTALHDYARWRAAEP